MVFVPFVFQSFVCIGQDPVGSVFIESVEVLKHVIARSKNAHLVIVERTTTTHGSLLPGTIKALFCW